MSATVQRNTGEPALSSHHVGTVGKQLFVSQEEGSHQKPAMLTCDLELCPPELRDNKLLIV